MPAPQARSPRAPIVEPVILSEVARRADPADRNRDRRVRPRARRQRCRRAWVSCPDLWCCWAARRGSASPRWSAPRSATSLPTARPCSTSRARNRPSRSACATSDSASAAMGVPVIAETDLDSVIATIEAQSPKPEVCVIDSVQTLYCADLSGAPGSVGQVREVAARLMQVAKSRDIAMLLVGHVTKEGSLAGPRVLEHLVDCVLRFEGERDRTFRMLRADKNRFGSTNEVGVFEMEEHGLVEVLDASARFVGDATNNPGLGDLRRHGGHAPDADRDPGAGLARRGRSAAARRQRHRSQPAFTDPRRARPSRGTQPERARRVRERGGRRAHRGAGADLAVALAVASAARNVGAVSNDVASRSSVSARSA